MKQMKYFRIAGRVAVMRNVKVLTLEDAFDKSIEKWTLRSRGIPIDVNDARSCGLCNFFIFCDMGCPIWKVTGENACDGTPYTEYRKNPTLPNAKKELRFLKKLKKIYCGPAVVSPKNHFHQTVKYDESLPNDSNFFRPRAR